MAELDYPRAILLGFVQGVTEFLPVSSDGHLTFLQPLLELDPVAPSNLLFDIMVHVGTLAAVLLVFRREFVLFFRRLRAEAARTWTGRRTAWRIALLAACATAVTGAIGMSFKPAFESTYDEPAWIAGGFITTGILLFGMALVPRGRRGWRQLSLGAAALIGAAQAMAILPGVSRSGSTISLATFFGLRRQWAAHFSFLIAVPAIAGAALVKLDDVLQLGDEALAAIPWGPIMAGTLVSALVGLAALKLLLMIVSRARLHLFAPYCWALAALILWRMS